MYKIVVVGGGTAGIMASTFLKAFWGDNVEVTTVYDRRIPNIGVGESLTPIFNLYLQMVGITTLDLVRNCNASIKLGLKFTNWVPGKTAVHAWPINDEIEQLADVVTRRSNGVDAYDFATNQYDNGSCYSDALFHRNDIPSDLARFKHALHIDATRTSGYIESRFADVIPSIDASVTEVFWDGTNITSLRLDNGQTITADLFIDASGLARVLIGKTGAKWNSVSDMLPVNSTIPNPVWNSQGEVPPYTWSNATDNGWIFDVALQNRHGTGYVYSSNFQSDEDAKQAFNRWLIANHNVELQSDRVIRFEAGYWDKTWVGNCVAVGLSSGFFEPLEATSIHTLVAQMSMLTRLHNLNDNMSHSRKMYNTFMEDLYVNTAQYLRFFYHTKRQDSEFWKYMTNTTPEWLSDLASKIEDSFISDEDILTRGMFAATDFVSVAVGHGMVKPESALKYLNDRSMMRNAKISSDAIRIAKQRALPQFVNHRQWLNRKILNWG